MGRMAERAQIIIRGIVQGVGFRPFVFTLAESLSLKGYVTNTSEGVLIDVEGEHVAAFIQRLRNEAPPLSQITDIVATPLPFHGYADFTIHKSSDSSGSLPFTLISPDVSICDDCLHELVDPEDRRYLYPFINCTNCGPRYSITRSVPYDRPNTTMSGFAMCPECLKEYHDPRDRRFHAQPNACPACGPVAEFRMRNAECGVKGEDAIRKTVTLLQNGGIVAIKGLGGFHIACDASNSEAVQLLRMKKRKSNKPFAVMAADLESIGTYCFVSVDEEKLLLNNRRPIVLLRKKEIALPTDVSPNNHYIGCMLPYTPLHYLLFFDEHTRNDKPRFRALVMTSGNLSEEPIVGDNDEAVQKLSGMVDGFLLHNRDIFMRVDDSVVRVQSSKFGVRSLKSADSDTTSSFLSCSELNTTNSALLFIRRSRGHAPDPIALQDEGPEVLGCGADLKNTFTLTKGTFAIVSQHIGDMENYETVKFFEECLANLKAVYRADPKVIVHDLHPGYLSTQWAIECGMRNAECGVRTFGIQHHYAHIGSVMAEHGLKGKVIGVAFDGTGYGTDGNLWGGEFLIADIDSFSRAGQLQYVALPGGESAIKEPWRTAVSYVIGAAGDKAWTYFDRIGFVNEYGKDTLEKVVMVARSRELSPLASGAGRLFDAVSALLGVCGRNTFEGEAAMAIESLTRQGIEDEYPVEFSRGKGYTVVNFNPTITAMIDDIMRAVGREHISTMFHNTVASVIQTVVRDISGDSGLVDVALSGGTFQNRYLLNKTIKALSTDGMNVFTNRKVPCNDGGISLGQAYLVRERLKKSGVRSSGFGVENEANAR